MAGVTTNGLPLPTAENGALPLRGDYLIAVDTQLEAGQAPQSIALPLAQITGALSEDGPHETAFAASITIDGANGLVQSVGTLTGNITVAFDNLTPGQVYRIKFTEDATGGRTITLTGAKVSGTATTTANAVNWLQVWSDGTEIFAAWQANFA